MTTTDTKFFTNDEGLTLLDRFKSTLKDARFFDVLVGFFRISGFYQLVDLFENIEKTRILVGLNVDRTTYEAILFNSVNGLLDFESDKNTKLQYEKNVIAEIESVNENNERVMLGIRKFFTNKAEMREKVVNKTYCKPLTI